jgi:hypothetical protein
LEGERTAAGSLVSNSSASVGARALHPAINTAKEKSVTENSQNPELIEQQLRELALVDRIFGLEAQLAEVSVFMNPDRDRFDAQERELAGLRQQVEGLRETRTWRVGRAVLAPLNALKRKRSE